MGLSGDRNYARYHQVLNRAAWSPLQLSQVLLRLLLQHLDRGDGPLVFGIDETLERRQGPRISAWASTVSGALQPQLCGQGQRSALDFPDVAGAYTLGRPPLGPAFPDGAGTLGTLLSATRPSSQEAHRLGPPDGPATAPLAAQPSPGTGGGQRLRCPDLLHFCQSLRDPVAFNPITPGSALYAPAPPRQPGRMGRPRVKGARLP